MSLFSFRTVTILATAALGAVVATWFTRRAIAASGQREAFDDGFDDRTQSYGDGNDQAEAARAQADAWSAHDDLIADAVIHEAAHARRRGKQAIDVDAEIYDLEIVDVVEVASPLG